MSKKKLTDISKIKDEKVVLTNQLANLKNHPEINFKYLWKCNVCCFNGLSKYNSKHKEEKVFDQLQKFLFEVDQCSSLEEVITQYTSSKGSKVDLSNDFVKRIKDKFEKAYSHASKKKWKREVCLIWSGLWQCILCASIRPRT